jgi:predicted phage terminase large subunit-like protein
MINLKKLKKSEFKELLKNNEDYQKALYSVKLEDDFYLFVKESWQHVVQDKLIDIPLVKILCNHMQALYEGRILNNRLAISIPPGFAKSLITCVFFPAWVWAKDPSVRFLTGSHSKDFATRDSKRTRDLIMSDWYQYYWGYKVQIVDDQNRKTHYETTAKGYRYVFGVTSGFTGTRADIILVDDALDSNETYSDVKRKSANVVIGKLHTRLNLSSKIGVICIIGQRLHVDDPIGHILSKKKLGFEYLCMPLQFDETTKAKTSIFEDNRKEGESLWAEEFTEEKIIEKKESMGSRDYNAQYQQNPETETGSIIHRDWMRYYHILPKRTYRIQSWDMAFTDKQGNDYCCCTTWDICENGYYLVDLFLERMEFFAMKSKAKSLYDKFKPNEIIVENKASGISLIQELKREGRLPVKEINVSKSKEARAHTASPLFEAGKIYLPDGKEWINDYIDELVQFPNVAHDDQTDSTTMAIIYMTQKMTEAFFVVL